MNSVGQDVLKSQHESLDATDAYASAWSVALAEATSAADDASGGNHAPVKVSWGGRGKGGRGMARRTFQPRDIVVDNVTLEYMNDASVTGAGGGGSKMLLNDAYLKLLPGRVYTLIGRNGVGKSSLLKRISAGRIPGFPPHITSLLVSQEVFGHDDLTPVDILLENHQNMREQAQNANTFSITQLEEEMDELDMESDDYQENIEQICNRIAELEDADSDDGENESIERAHNALHFFGVPESAFSTPTAQLSGGIRKKVALACALIERPQLLLLDEPTCHIDIGGILQLRQLIADCVDSNTTVVLVSHDVDLMNDVATDVIDFRDEKLSYYTGNYEYFVKYRKERITHQVKQAGALEKQRSAMATSIDNLKKKSSASHNSITKKKINKAIKSKGKKLERHGVEKNDSGHHRTAQTDGGIRKGSINAIGASQRKNMTHKELLRLAETDIGPVPDKAVQFDFENTTSTWGDEPLAMVMDVGHGYQDEKSSEGPPNLIFDCVDLSFREGSRTTFLGENSSGKSSLLSIIAGKITPSVGNVHFANGITIGHYHQHSVDQLIQEGFETQTPLSFLTKKFPSKSEQDIRGELIRFGLSPKQATTNVRFLSGGERCRMCMVSMMLECPQLLVIDEISNHLDVESVEALIYGLKKWNGTVVMASHDANLIRAIGGESYVLFDGKLRRIEGGIDTYLEIFAKYYHKPKA
mmetsp:Transcript_14166/g.30789  ORF Transcript_14166/g.30789 Transcript_14166/m.30789 type:complete len:699 (+) Transcript_14166:109-2205(+)|eukprot:CAMPEP_0172314114 /NCGR_PEP_ID=MMETSP1058-20130122/21713_1 /TAXON_ID=83371 /ORGANISM="Detonula confervacea, Strain CCMP 353" /LENGTH=698 /DNA_ID=CAMNT_0013027895 /DNA_START=41 /DNA_END=2137 /DNA_ORIENTATION=+